MGHKIDRRDFLSLMGLGGAAAVTLSCGNSPNFDEKWHPWVEPVEGTIPYVPNFYATTTHESDGLGLRIRTIEGRAQLAHGNPEHPFSAGDQVGSITARQQSVIEGLYGPGRVRKPLTKKGEITWRQAGDLIQQQLQKAKGNGVYALTGAFTGATAEIWDRFVAEMGTGKVVRYSAFSKAPLALASELVFGQKAAPLVSLAGADLVVSLGAQFLETWGDVTAHSIAYAEMRDVVDGKRGRHIQIEARCSGTGGNADQWLAAKPGSETHLALGLLKAVSSQKALDSGLAAQIDALTAGHSLESAASASGLKAEVLEHLAKTLAGASAPVVLPAENLALGQHAVAHHAAVLLLNKALGAIGRAYNYSAAIPGERIVDHKAIVELTQTLNNGGVQLLLVKGVNPVYSLPGALGFKDALAKTFTIAFADSIDETTACADLVIPVTHDLESWGEVNTYAGLDMLMQPVMRPRWEAKQAEDHLIEWMLANRADAVAQTNFRDFLQASWTGRFGADWRGALKKGGSFNIAAGTDLPLASVSAELFNGLTAVEGKRPLLLVESARFGDGSTAGRGWMQELPDSMTGVTWDSWLEMHPKVATELGVTYGDLVTVSVGSQKADVPAFLIESIGEHVITLATGQGHTGLSPEYNRGTNAFDFLSTSLNDAGLFSAGPLNASFTKGSGSRKLATPQLPGWGDRMVTPLHEIGAGFGPEDEHYARHLHRSVGVAELEHGGHHGGHFDEAMLNEQSRFARPKTRMAETYLGYYPNRDDDKVYTDRDETFYDPYKWELAIDLNRCTGCGSCVTACYGENNLPIVGREQVIRGREMAWIRINRYLGFTKSGEVTVNNLPMMCQQCGNAPCESVCPSLATYHTKEGLNAMVYNRCVGTRYCSNNCSYKVRRFNWFTWEDHGGFPGDMRWQMNPAVSVRQKGVMEKCTFCAQRLREAKSIASDQGRLVQEGDVRTACQEACPSQAISFGNVKQAESAIAKATVDARAYKALDDHLHTKPGVTYLKRVTLDSEHHG